MMNLLALYSVGIVVFCLSGGTNAVPETDILEILMDIKEEVGKLRTDVDVLKEEVILIKTAGNTSAGDQLAGEIGFTAFVEISESYNAGNIIQFPEVLTNFGNGYNPGTGIFTCPLHGLYLFSSTGLSEADQQMRFMLKTPSKDILKGDAASTSGYETGIAGIAVMECNQGESVYIECLNSGDVVRGQKSSSFSGVLLYLII